MKIFVALITVLASLTCFFSCSENIQTKEVNYNQLQELSEDEKFAFKTQIIRFVGRKPEDASHENKFHPYFDEHYQKQVQAHDLTHYYDSKNGKTYFVLTRIAPSIELKRVAIGGWVTWTEESEVKNVYQTFRTWKNKPDTLQKRSDVLFTLLVENKPLTDYLTESRGDTEYIEFPNSEVWFDSVQGDWVSSREDVLKEFIDEKIARTEEKIKIWEEEQQNLK